jgi:hypothetical protein
MCVCVCVCVEGGGGQALQRLDGARFPGLAVARPALQWSVPSTQRHGSARSPPGRSGGSPAGRIGPAGKATAVLARLQAMPLSCLFPSRSTLSDPFPSTNAAFPSSQCLVPLMFPRPRSNASFRSPSEQGLVPLSFLFRQRLVPLQSKPRAPSTQGLVPLLARTRSPAANALFPCKQRLVPLQPMHRSPSRQRRVPLQTSSRFRECHVLARPLPNNTSFPCIVPLNNTSFPFKATPRSSAKSSLPDKASFLQTTPRAARQA